MKHESKFNSGEELQPVSHQLSEQKAALEFATAEELLRHDALHTPVPPTIARRLQDTIGETSPPPSSWWRRLLGS